MIKQDINLKTYQILLQKRPDFNKLLDELGEWNRESNKYL